jgi:hypothetical protein
MYLTGWKILRFHIHPVVEQEYDEHSHCDVQNHCKFSFSARRKSSHNPLPVKVKNLHLNVPNICLPGRETCPIHIYSAEIDRPIQTVVCMYESANNVTKLSCTYAVCLRVTLMDMTQHDIAYLCY